MPEGYEIVDLTCKEKPDPGPSWAIILAVIGSIVVLIIIVILICVRKIRKKRIGLQLLEIFKDEIE